MLPKNILVDTSEIVVKLRQLPHTQPTDVWRLFITYVLQDIVDCLRDGKVGVQNLMALTHEIERGKYKQYFNQPQHLATVVAEVGLGIAAAFAHLKLYDPDGLLRYHYYPVNDPFFNDILLIRELALCTSKESNHDQACVLLPDPAAR